MKILVGKDIGAYTFDASAKTVTFSSMGTVNLEDILLITNVTDNVIIYNFADNLLGGTISSNTVTLTYNTTSMDDADALQIFVDVGELGYDSTLGSFNMNTNNPVYAQKTDAESLATEQDVTASYADLGTEIVMGNNTHLGIAWKGDVNDSTDVQLKLVRVSDDGVDEYDIYDGGVLQEMTLWSTTPVSDLKQFFEIETGSIDNIKLKVKAGVVGSVAANLTVEIIKIWR